MTPVAPLRRAVLAPTPVVALVVALALAGCSDKPVTVTPVETASSERLDALERDLKVIREERDSLRGSSVSSSEGLALANRLKEMQARIAELEAKNAALAAAVPAAPGAAPATDTSGGALYPVPGVPPISTDVSQPIPTETIAAFRRISDEVDKIKTAEQQAKRLKDDLARAGVTLSPEQEAAVGKLQQAYTEKIRSLYREGAGSTDADRQALVAQREALRTQYEVEIRAVVPASDADKIVEAMSRGGGFPGARCRAA